ncbi:beta-1,3-galactosyltransferase 2-like [Pelobates fuscus]|uniref:beta-1,3-galactosyltransferase 2-like n=1 Tax=Pelobates fuscus TaxID=191477 RepID=UPI002FE49591
MFFLYLSAMFLTFLFLQKYKHYLHGNMVIDRRYRFYILLIFLPGLFFIFGMKTNFINKWSVTQEHEKSNPYPEQTTIEKSTTRHPLAPPYPYPYRFLINSQDKCLNRKPFLVILVISNCHDIAARNAIRQTWGNESNYINVDMVNVFLVGMSPTASGRVQTMLEEESETFGDIIQQDFLDKYYNLTIKSLMGFQWVTQFCPSARYVLKTDSDTFINVEYLVHQILFPEQPVRTNYFSGNIVANTGPLRAKAYKWYVPVEVYPNDTYPPYCSGPTYVFSVDMAKKIYDIAQIIKVIPMEDSFMGICLYHMNIPPTEPPKNVFVGGRIEYDHCKFKKLITVHHYQKEELINVWQDFWGNKIYKC